MDRHDLRMCMDRNIIGNFGLFKGYFRNYASNLINKHYTEL